MPFTVDLERPANSTDARLDRPPALETLPVARPQASTLRASRSRDVDPDERPTDPAPPVHSFWIPKFPKDPRLPDLARLYSEALEHVRAVEASDVPGHSTFRPAPVLRHQYRPARLPAKRG